jgi:hypothetical protein
MKLKINTPIVNVGQVGRNKFKAEVHPQARVIICSSEPVGELLPNNDTEERARFIAKRLFLRHAPLSMMFRFWLYVEAQTCFGEVTLKRIGSKRQNGKLCTTYEDLTPEEAKKVQPLIQSTRDQLESRIQGQKPESARKLDALGNVQAESVRTPSPSATR